MKTATPSVHWSSVEGGNAAAEGLPRIAPEEKDGLSVEAWLLGYDQQMMFNRFTDPKREPSGF
jgi:hypothetical protein